MEDGFFPERASAPEGPGDAIPGRMSPRWQVTCATVCPHLGRVCPVGLDLTRRLVAAMATGAGGLPPDFEISGTLEAVGCIRACRLGWQAGARATWVRGDLATGETGAGPGLAAAAITAARPDALIGAEVLPDRLA